MLKVVSVSDKVDTAIDRLCKGVSRYHNNIEYIVCDVHPKRPDPEQLARFEEAIKDVDIMDYQYFRTADMLRERYPQLKEVPSILTHNNPYSIHERDWNDYEIVVANNLTMQADLSKITSSKLEYIPLTVDHTFWSYNNDWQPKKQVIMVANRIESKKGIREAAIAAAELGLKFILVGAISDMDYFNGVMAAGNVEYHEQITNEHLRELYYESQLHICNSQDNFESGTLPILESMYCGTPVLTRRVGHVPDLYNGENMFIYEGDYEDVIALTEAMKQAIESDKLDDIRGKAWNTVKTRNFERRAYAYQKLYRSLVDDSPTVSIIMPICGKVDITKQSLAAIEAQTYKNIELIIIDDGESSDNAMAIKHFKSRVKFPVRKISNALRLQNKSKDYGLARARNRGIIEATGEILVFSDQRIVMDKKSVEVFVANTETRNWLYGTKGVKKEFVENFSSIKREDIVKLGMFNERCTKYGALSQETRSRAKYNGYKITYIEEAKANQVGKSSNKFTRRAEIIDSKNWLWKVGMEL